MTFGITRPQHLTVTQHHLLHVSAVAYIFDMFNKEVGNILITMINISRVHSSTKGKPVTDWMLADRIAQKISGIF